jgi:hypothetical protein
MPANPVPVPGAADSTGLPESSWIADVRDALEDFPRWLLEQTTADGINGVSTAGAAPISVQFPKINGSATAGDNTPLVQDFTSSTNFTVVDYPTAPTSGQVQVNYDTGELTFNTPPTNQHVLNVSYQTCKWRDKSILSGLLDGLRAMFPICGKTYLDTSIQIIVDKYDYQLPSWFNDPRSKIISIEIADPYIPTEPFRPAPPGEDRIGLGLLHLPWSQSYSPTARLRIVGWGPYLRLGDLEPQLYNLPIYYALGVLLPKRETKRIREDTLVPLAQLGSAQPTLHMQTGDYWARRFTLAQDNLARLPGPTNHRPWASMRQRMRYR